MGFGCLWPFLFGKWPHVAIPAKRAKEKPVNKQQLSPSNRAHVEQFLGKVAVERAQATEEEWDVERLLAEMQSPDPLVRAKAVRQICPSRIETLAELRFCFPYQIRQPSCSITEFYSFYNIL